MSPLRPEENMKLSSRLEAIPPYLFAQLDRMKEEKKAQGVDVISLGIGDPDMPSADLVVEAMKKAVEKPVHHQYPPYQGTREFTRAVADFYRRRFGVTLESDGEVLALIGSKEGIAHISLAVLDPGDLLLCPDPAYPVYRIGALFAGAGIHTMPLLRQNGFLPDFARIPAKTAKKASLMFLNYPNNPTSAVANIDFYREAVEFARKYDIIIASDNAYSEIYFDGNPPPSILEVPGAKDVAVEFFSLSKPYNMTGWRIGALAGNRQVVDALGTIKKNIDSGTFTAIQEAAVTALREGEKFSEKMRKTYRRRRDKMVDGLKSFGINVDVPAASLYIWAPTPDGMPSMEFARDLLDRTGVLVTPGVGFGEHGEGFFRISLTVPDNRLNEAVERIKKLKFVRAL
jgi:LL-diaminopimelate aminotransferase